MIYLIMVPIWLKSMAQTPDMEQIPTPICQDFNVCQIQMTACLMKGLKKHRQAELPIWEMSREPGSTTLHLWQVSAGAATGIPSFMIAVPHATSLHAKIDSSITSQLHHAISRVP